MSERFDLCWLGGRVVPLDEARIHPLDPLVIAGSGLIETLAVREGRVEFVEAHLARLERSERELGLPHTDAAEVRRAVRALLTTAGVQSAALRIVRSNGAPDRGPTLLIDLRRLPEPPTDGVTLDLVVGGLAEPGGLDAHKHTGRFAKSVLRERALAAGHFDAVLATEGGRLLEATGANLVLARGGAGLTPAAGPGVLPGVMRAVVLDSGLVEEADLGLADLAATDEVVLSSSLLGCCPARSIAGRPGLLAGPSGRLFSALGAALAAARDATRSEDEALWPARDLP